MTSRDEAARTIAYFDQCDDMTALRSALEEAAPRIKKMVTAMLKKGAEESIPGPAELRGAKEPASPVESLRTLRTIPDFALLQAITRAIGRRVETLEIAASADFPNGARVIVPSGQSYPRTGPERAGVVEETGTVLSVLLDSGETWEGPASLARLEPR